MNKKELIDTLGKKLNSFREINDYYFFNTDKETGFIKGCIRTLEYILNLVDDLESESENENS